MLVFFNAMQQYSSCGRVVKATDSKSVSLWERRFESYQLRHGFLDDVSESLFSSFGLLSSVTGHQFLDSLVVRISACHVEGPGSIPGRGEHFLCCLGSSKQWMDHVGCKKTLAIRGIEPVTFALLARRSNQLS